MKKRIIWKLGDFVVVKVRDGLYTVANMVGKTVICVYDIFRSEDYWDDLDWSQVQPLFQAFVGGGIQKNLMIRKLLIEGGAARAS